MRYVSHEDILHLKRSSASHKGDNGTILVIGGSEEYPGAAYLAAKAVACLRAGADIVKIAAPARVAWAINAMCPDLITAKMEGGYLDERHFEDINRLARKADVILIGNGTGTREGTRKLLLRIMKCNAAKLKVLDADGIKMLKLQDVCTSIVTPHSAELAALLKKSRLTKTNLRRYLGNNVILLKGRIDKIISCKETAYNRTGNAGMTVGGTGDILAGLCAGYLAQSKDLFRSAVTAAYINGLIGDRLQKKLGNGLMASDFLPEIARLGHKLRIG